MSGGNGRLSAAAALMLVLGLASSAAAEPILYTLVTDPGYARRSAGVDGLIGTADDVSLPVLPGPDGIPATADDVIVNPSGSVSYLLLAALPLGGDYEVFWPGTLTVQEWNAVTGAQQATGFALSGPATFTNGLTGSVSDGPAAPRILRLEGDASGFANFPLRVCTDGSCTDVTVAYLGGTLTNQPGRDDPSFVPGLTPAQAAYLGSLKSLLPSSWTQLWLLMAPPTVLGAADVSGDQAPFLVGGQASALLAFYTTDRAVLAGDDDGDGVPNASDNCPFAANPSQADNGGIGSISLPDGVGDACQCGDVTGDGRVTLADAVAIQRSVLVPPTATLAKPDLCDVVGGTGCALADAAVVRRALLAPPTASIIRQCAPARP